MMLHAAQQNAQITEEFFFMHTIIYVESQSTIDGERVTIRSTPKCQALKALCVMRAMGQWAHETHPDHEKMGMLLEHYVQGHVQRNVENEIVHVHMWGAAQLV